MMQPEFVPITFEVPARHAPALRAAVDELRGIVAKRLESPHPHRQEQALTSAVVGLGALAKAVNAAVPSSDPWYA